MNRHRDPLLATLVVIPLEQGLKPVHPTLEGACIAYSRSNSIRTRIETQYAPRGSDMTYNSRSNSIRTRIETPLAGR